MLKKYSILIGLIFSIVLLVIAMMVYPGGTRDNINSVGYDWSKNYISNLFGEKALNGAINPARYWAVAAMLFLAVSVAAFYISFSKRIYQKGAANVVKWFGIGAALFSFLTVTPYHDIMVTIACTMNLVAVFYITVFTFKTKLHFHKFLCVLCLLVFYCCMYIYYSGKFVVYLAIFQKLALVVKIVWVLSLYYFTKPEDFQPKKKVVLEMSNE